MRNLFIILACLLACTSCQTRSYLFQEGVQGSVVYQTGELHLNKEVTIHYYIPVGAHKHAQIIMHGTNRNGEDYLNAWKEKADEKSIALFAPEFDKEAFPVSWYQEGGVVNAEGLFRGSDSTSYQILDDILCFINRNIRKPYASFNMFGHSAGGQFVHRFMLLHQSPYVDKAVAANAGWYTFPTDTIAYPYGILGLSKDFSQLRKDYLAKNLYVLLGTADTVRDRDLRTTPEADAQGQYRFARGLSFYDFAAKIAQEEGLPFHWRIDTVEGVAHNYRKMTQAAADLLY